MGKRGPKSNLTVVPTASRVRRPPPPSYLGKEAAEVWRATVAQMPQGWFSAEHHPTLADYCEHVVRGRFLSRELAKFKPDWLSSEEGVKRYEKLAAAAERETRAMLACARSLRLSHQARQQPKSAWRQTMGQYPEGEAPWEWNGDTG